MNDQNPTFPGKLPELAGIIPGTTLAASVPPAGGHIPDENLIEQIPIQGVVAAVEAMLRQPRRVMFQLKQPRPGGLIAGLILIAGLCSLIYGIVVGTFSGGVQLWAAPVKIAAGLFISALICLPSLYIFSCLSGSQARLVEVFGLVAGLLALMTVLLIGFAPVAWVFSQSTKSPAAMGALHLAFWVVATFFGLRFLHAGFKHFSSMSGARTSGINVWVVIFLFVALQMTTALRPIVGKSGTFLPAATEKKFFVNHWLDCFKAEQQDGGQSPEPAK